MAVVLILLARPVPGVTGEDKSVRGELIDDAAKVLLVNLAETRKNRVAGRIRGTQNRRVDSVLACQSGVAEREKALLNLAVQVGVDRPRAESLILKRVLVARIGLIRVVRSGRRRRRRRGRRRR